MELVMHLKSDFGIDRKTRQASGIIGDLEYLAPIAAIKEMADYPRLLRTSGFSTAADERCM